MRLDNPVLVRWEYASEERFAKRTELYRELMSGDNPEEIAVAAVAERKPESVLDVGCGVGDLTQRFVHELGAAVKAIDTSPRMVELARARGIDAQVADAEQLPFEDGTFDCVFAGWVLYHVPNLEQAIAECARVLRPGGRLVASTYFEDNISELWDLIEGVAPRDPLSFNHVNGAALLRRSFSSVEQRDVSATLTFPDSTVMRAFVAATIDRAHLAPQVPDIEGPFLATTRHVVFVAELAA
ncbi:MAG TPA: class I SAM-dependent methyltransferase [Gaiellaceae bacterium]|nr:class I SAM-dependent methyltransferase [Gaiellaceae bacterium]